MLNTKEKGHFIYNENFKTIFIELWFPYVQEKKDIISSYFLPSLLVKTNALYPKEEVFRRKLLEKSILDITCGRIKVGKNYFLRFTLTMPDESLITIEELKEGISFFFHTVYEPNIKNHVFDQTQFTRVKARLLASIENGLKNINTFTMKQIINEIDTEGVFEECIYNHVEEAKDIENSEIVSFYERKIEKKRPFIFVIGKVRKREIESLIEKELSKRNVEDIQIKKEYTNFLPCLSESCIIKKDKGDFVQSCLALVYKVKDMKEEDRLPLRMISSLLSSQSSGLLMKSLRDEKNLVYTCGSTCYSQFGLLLLSAKISKESYEEAKEQMMKTIEVLKTGNIGPLLQNIKDRRRVNLKRKLDNKFAIVDDVVDYTLGFDKTMEEEYEEMLQIKEEDIALLAQRLHLELIYFVEEDGNEH